MAEGFTLQGRATGELTFVFTDVEGSTKLWEREPAAMRPALTRHDELIEGIVTGLGGQVVRPRGEGDSRFIVFERAEAAVAAARDVQLALLREPWPTSRPIRVRMALHTGSAELREGDYYGSDVNRCARIRSLAHGGQTLLSGATAERARRALPEGVTLKGLGLHRLKDLAAPEQVYQLVHAELPADFPALRSLSVLLNNLPAQVSSFVGRERELEEVKRLVTGSRMVTLTGTGGAGKTRLAVQLAADVIDDFADGVWYVELAPLAEETLVPQQVASALDVREQGDRTLLAALCEHLRPKELLLVLDNCEHVVATCASLADALLRAAPHLRIVATSREPLGVAGETVWRIPSLAAPAAAEQLSPGRLVEYPSVRLFVERARSARPGFDVVGENAPAVAEIVRRLDGIPLAIELAAARIKVMSAQQIASHLDDRFRLLTGGSRTALPRQQTLRAVVDYSWSLLSDGERVLMRRLAVFAASWSMEAAEAVCADDALPEFDVLDHLARLVDRSLVNAEERGDVRYRFPETIRAYAREKLAETEDGDAVRRRHRDRILALADGARTGLFGAEQEEWLRRLGLEDDDIRAALTWTLEIGEIEAGLRIAGSLAWHWYYRGHISEGRGWLERLLARADPPPSSGRGLALMAHAQLLWVHGEFERARATGEDALRAASAIGDPWLVAVARGSLGSIAASQGDFARAREDLDEALRLSSAADLDPFAALGLRWLGYVEMQQGDAAAARERLGESLARSRRAGDRIGSAGTLSALGSVLRQLGDAAGARAALEESLPVLRRLGDRRGIANTLGRLAVVASDLGDASSARSLALESVAILRDLGDRVGIASVLKVVAATEAKAERALRLASAADAIHGAIGGSFTPIPQTDLGPWLDRARAELGTDAAGAAWDAGARMTLDDAVAYAFGSAEPERAPLEEVRA